MSDYDTLTVEFKYQIEGISHVGKQEWPDYPEWPFDFLGWKEPADMAQAQREYSKSNYQQGKTVSVYYNPKNPAQAYVAPEIAFTAWVTYAMCFFRSLVSHSFVKGGEKLYRQGGEKLYH